MIKLTIIYFLLAMIFMVIGFVALIATIGILIRKYLKYRGSNFKIDRLEEKIEELETRGSYETETGTPVQYLRWNESNKCWDIFPGIIHSGKNSIVSVIAFVGNKSPLPLTFKENLRHEDFKMIGLDCWRFLPQSPGGQVEDSLYPNQL